MRGVPIKKICPQCGKEFECLKSKETKFCSNECYINSRRTGTDIICNNCGKVFYRRQYHIDRQKDKNQNNFCSIQCQKEYLHKVRFELRECEICGASFEVSKLSKQRFCSDECQHVWQTKNVGELNPRFESILTPCSYYGSMSLDSKPQLVVNDILDVLQVSYEREVDFEFFSVDNYLIDYNLIIEVQGDYWHTNPLKFTSNVTNSQYDRIGRDKAKHSYIKNQYGIECLYLWESDILNNKELCIMLISEYIQHNGILKDYNSFNYSVVNGKLILNDNIVTPYFSMSVDQYKHLLNIAM